MGGIYKARTNGFSQEAVDENLKQVYMLEKILIDFGQVFHLYVAVGHYELNVKIVFSSQKLVKLLRRLGVSISDKLFEFFKPQLVILPCELPMLPGAWILFLPSVASHNTAKRLDFWTFKSTRLISNGDNFIILLRPTFISNLNAMLIFC